MALNAEVIKANEALASLTDEQVNAIATLSTNDEAVAVENRVSAIVGELEPELKPFGIERGTDKATDFVKKAVVTLKTKAQSASEFQTQLQAAQAEKAKLEEQIASGKGNEALNQKISDLTTQINGLKDLHGKDKAAWEAKESKFLSDITNQKVEAELDRGLAGLKFKAEYPDSVKQTMISTAKKALTTLYKPDFIEGTQGNVLVFRDANGQIMGNPKNQLNPYTASELIAEQLKDIIETKSAGGAGSKNPGGGNGGGGSLDMTGAKTQVEADDLIQKHLMAKGLTRGSAEFAAEHKKLREENKVSGLPIR